MKTKTIIVTLTMAAAFSVQAEDKVALATEIPEAMFEGTKVPLKLDNLEKVEVKQTALMVPKGVVLLSNEKPVTASDDLPVIGDLTRTSPMAKK
ncbi:MAG: hypothetical protein ACKVHP_17780 [Verrucomicrobiales bacterium]